jgi:hypothetical protein
LILISLFGFEKRKRKTFPAQQSQPGPAPSASPLALSSPAPADRWAPPIRVAFYLRPTPRLCVWAALRRAAAPWPSLAAWLARLGALRSLPARALVWTHTPARTRAGLELESDQGSTTKSRARTLRSTIPRPINTTPAALGSTSTLAAAASPPRKP